MSRLRFSVWKNTSLGMTLVELSIFLGIASLVSLGSAYLMQDNIKTLVRTQSRKNVISQISDLSLSLRRQAGLSGSCLGSIHVPTAFNPSSKTPSQLTLGDETYESGSVISQGLGGASFRLDQVYLGESQLLATTSSEKTYLTNLFFEASVRSGSSWIPLQPKSVGVFSVRVSSSGSLTDCNVNSIGVDNETLCRAISGMRWNSSLGTCTQEISFVGCPPGMISSPGGQCVLQNSGCYNQYLPKDFDRGIVENCEVIPAGYVVENPSGYSPANYPVASEPLRCQCGNSSIGQSPDSPSITSQNVCVSCQKEDGCWGGFQSCYYYTVETCGAGGNLAKLQGPDANGSFKDEHDPPSYGTCRGNRSLGSYRPDQTPRVIQFR